MENNTEVAKRYSSRTHHSALLQGGRVTPSTVAAGEGWFATVQQPWLGEHQEVREVGQREGEHMWGALGDAQQALRESWRALDIHNSNPEIKC